MIHHSSRTPTTVPITMPAMAPPSRPEPDEDPPLFASTTTVVVGSWRGRSRVRAAGSVRVGGMMVGCCDVAGAEYGGGEVGKNLVTGTPARGEMYFAARGLTTEEF